MIIPFIPAKDFDESVKFYKHLGFKVDDPTGDDVRYAECTLLDNAFILQELYVKEWAENTMMIVEVSSFKEILTKVKTYLEENESDQVKVKGPLNQGYGEQLHLLDPSGVLWHVFEKK